MTPQYVQQQQQVMPRGGQQQQQPPIQGMQQQQQPPAQGKVGGGVQKDWLHLPLLLQHLLRSI